MTRREAHEDHDKANDKARDTAGDNPHDKAGDKPHDKAGDIVPRNDAHALRLRLRELVTGQPSALAPFCWDALSARLAELAGARVVFMSGYGVCTSLAMPDIGIVTQQEMVLQAARIARTIGIPLIVDADDGYGGPANVKRTVEEPFALFPACT